MNERPMNAAAPWTRWVAWCAWAFIFAVALGDIAFAYLFRDDLPSWETNPVGCWTFQVGGIWALAGYRFAITGYACLMASTRTRWSRWITRVWLAAHLGLALYLPACLSHAHIVR